ncbi:MAG: AIM24 family protein [Lachnospiraceae bacterium]|nr:AIM24 family protein [Lachnospiraceae bacterium]
MEYRIVGDNLPVLLLQLHVGEKVTCEAGAMSWMDDEIEMQTEAGGLGKMFGRLVTGEKMFQNHYVARRDGEIAFSSHFPGSIRAIEITPDRPIIVQKGSYLASFGNIEQTVFLQKKMGSGFFGGEGFLMHKFSGTGIVFLEIDGSAIEYDIAAGDKKIIDTGYVAMMDASCSMDIQSVKGAKNVLFGGEGFFNTVVHGPGHVILQSMPIYQTALELFRYMPSSSN